MPDRADRLHRRARDDCRQRQCRRAIRHRDPRVCMQPLDAGPLFLRCGWRVVDRAATRRSSHRHRARHRCASNRARSRVMPRGMRFCVELRDAEAPARGYVCENYGALLRLPELGPIGANGLANPRDFLAPVAAYERAGRRVRARREVRRPSVARGDRSFAARRRRVARQLRAVQVRSRALQHDQHGELRPSRPVDLHRADVAVATRPGTANVDFVIFPPRWMVAEERSARRGSIAT